MQAEHSSKGDEYAREAEGQAPPGARARSIAHRTSHAHTHARAHGARTHARFAFGRSIGTALTAVLFCGPWLTTYQVLQILRDQTRLSADREALTSHITALSDEMSVVAATYARHNVGTPASLFCRTTMQHHCRRRSDESTAHRRLCLWGQRWACGLSPSC